MQSTGELFLSHSMTKLTQMTGHIDTCLKKLTPAQIWNQAGDTQNSVGNLVLHLCGNLRQWIGWSIGGERDIRDRPAEFAASSEIGTEALLEKLSSTVRDAIAILQNLPPSRLADLVQTQDGERSILEVIYQVVGHFQQHAGQIIFATKLVTQQDLKFYAPTKKST
jgi:hypothetical protein